MLGILRERFRQGYRTLDYPFSMPAIPGRFAGLPSVDPSRCPDCRSKACLKACPAGALAMNDGRGVSLDMGRCLFCRSCELACPEHAIVFTHEHRLASYQREALVINSPAAEENCRPGVRPALGKPKRKLAIFGRSLKLRQVSAGGCMACEADINVLGTLAYDLGRFGIEYAASPRHADGLIITGPVTQNMRKALIDTWNAVPDPKVVIAVGCCAVSGGIFRSSSECSQGVDDVLPPGSIDIYIPGCPPNPWTILDGILSVAWKDAQN
ncbi:MAG: 4Fe-4S dicluster domain-containing protein [Desulfovibrio sp.]|jgi:Ni,Fe-hydrogenase III small subunit/NAD-dependent dihydropyrimidine dehydrogenase PreA subunit